MKSIYEYNLGLRFENIVKHYPDHTALIFNSIESISYSKLNRKVNQLARYLLHEELKTGDVICISGVKNIYTFTCMLACLKIGAAYSILDDKSPVERLNRIVTRCMPKILFIDEKLELSLTETIRKLKATVIHNNPQDLERMLNKLSQYNIGETRKITGTNPAYIMFTSGSTGFPKGALMTHANVLNLISWSVETYNILPTDILTNVNPLYFDNSVFDFYSALFSGACLVPFTRDEVANPSYLVNKIDELKCTQWFSVPSLLIYLDTMKVLKEKSMQHIKRFIFGGEGYPKPKLKNLFDLYSKRSTFYNVYGPTECTCICSSYKITEKDFTDMKTLAPLGSIAGNFSYLILNNKGQKTAENEIGELCLLGPNVGKGYFNDHERTRDKFVQNPANTKFNEKMYKTGDLVRYNPNDSNIYFVGRVDNQIKHMGYRIELDEIELALNRLHYISQAAVIHGRVKNLSQIIAVISTKEKITEKLIRQDLKQLLPAYMIPTRIDVLDDLPKNANGKIDRQKLNEIYFN